MTDLAEIMHLVFDAGKTVGRIQERLRNLDPRDPDAMLEVAAAQAEVDQLSAQVDSLEASR